MRLTMDRPVAADYRRYTLIITDDELAAAPLDNVDRLLIRDVEMNGGDSGKPIADALLALQTIAFRIEQAHLSHHNEVSR